MKMMNNVTVDATDNPQERASLGNAKRRAPLLITSAMALVISSAAYAGTVTVPAGPATEAAVDASIAANPDPALTLDIKAGAVITGVGTTDVDIAPVGANNAGEITVINNGSVGTVAAGVITNDTGIRALGVGKLDAANTATVTNNGLITGGLQVANFGGAVNVTNAGTVHQGVQATSFGDATITTSSSGSVVSGVVDARAFQTTTTTTVGGINTTVNAGGNAKVVQQGNSVSVDGLTKVNVSATADKGNADVTVSKVAGNVAAQAGFGLAKNVFGGDAAAASKTVTTFINEQSFSTGQANVTIENGANVENVISNGAGGGTVVIDGKAVSVSQQTFGVTSSSFVNTETQDAASKTTQLTSAFSSTPSGGDQSLKIGATGEVTGALSASSFGGKSAVSIDGVAGAAVTVSNSADKNGSASVTNINPATGLATDSSSSKFSRGVGGDVSLAVGSKGTVAGTVGLTTNAGAIDATVDGKLATALNATSSGNDSTSSSDSKFDALGNTLQVKNANSNTATGGAVTGLIGSAGSVANNASFTSSAGAVKATIDGSVSGNLSLSSTGFKSTNSTVNNFDPTTLALSDQKNVFTAGVTGSTASATISKSGNVKGAVTATANGGVTISNAGAIGGGINANSLANILTSTGSSTVLTSNVTPTLVESSNTGISSFKQESVGGKISITNDAGGLISGTTNANALGDIAYVNNGAVRGQTNLSSTGFSFDQVSNNFTSSSAVITPLPTDKTTTVTKSDATVNQNSTGGSVSGTYANANGTLNFSPSADGSVNQNANKDSTATVSGAIFGNLTSDAGNGTTNTQMAANNSTIVLDTTGKGTGSGGGSSSSIGSDGPGTSTVSITGIVGKGNVGSAANVNSFGSTGSKVTLTNGIVEGSIQSFSSLDSNKNAASNSFEQNYTAFAPTTTKANDTQTTSNTRAGGASSVDVLGTSKVGGSVSVTGVQSVSAKVDTNASVGSSVSVTASGNDNTGETTRSYTRDATTGVVAASDFNKNTSGPAAASGNASADVAGTVGGSVNVSANRGNATASITGTSGGVGATASGTSSSSSALNEYAGKAAAGGSTSAFGNPIPALTKQTLSSTSTAIGGKASVTVDTSAALKALNTGGVNGSVNATGSGGAAISVTSGSKINGSATSNSIAFSSKSDSVETFGTVRTLNGTSSSTFGGADASVTNAGTISGSAAAFGRTVATVTNTGKIGGNAVAGAIGVNQSNVTTDTNIDNAALRTEVVTTSRTAVGGDAKVTNAAGSTIMGGAFVSGATGSISNSGAVAGQLVVGDAYNNLTETVTRTATTTTSKLAPVTLFAQTYTVDNNGTASGVRVGGATVNFTPAGSTTSQVIKTSDIKATVNLNNGSATLGSIDAQRDSLTGAFLTTTTVNLNGAGFLGADEVYFEMPTDAVRNPALVLSKDAMAAGFGTGTIAARVLGVTALNKTGAGTFVVNGAKYDAPAASGLLPTWTLDVGNFNINAGEVQLNTETAGQFGINGNVTNNATLVIGRRRPIAVQAVGDSLVGSGTETIGGISVRQTGNFTQGATGNTVVGINPTLTRFGPTTIGTSGSAPELLGAVGAGVGVPFFTTPTKAGNAHVGSRWDITGNLNLAGKVTTDINRNSLFSDGDGYTLFTYTGTGSVTATVDTSIKSKFVTLALKHDATAKIVALAASRTSYATGATNPNAVNAATGLDSALSTVITRIKADASGGAGFATATQIGQSQDIANIASALDWRLSTTQAAQVFDELSSGEFYGSLSAVDQNLAFGRSVDLLSGRRAAGQDLVTSLWFNPVGNFAEYGDTAAGNSEIQVNSYGGAGGFDFAYSDTGAFGLGFGYTQHDASARGTLEEGRGRTYTVGAYFTHGLDEFYVNGMLAYGFSKFDTQRDLTLLARSITADFKGKQLDASLEVGYDYTLGNNFVVTPFGELGLRRSSFEGFTENNGGGIALDVDKSSKSVFSPVLGVKLTGVIAANSSGFQLRPYGKLAYTFQGDINSTRTVRYVGGGNDFTLRGVDPDSFGLAELGVDATVNNRLNVFVGGGFNFGGQNKASHVQGGVSIKF